ncbi:helix-turn-helix transcriptional regulator [Desemzia sp. RIT804]|uniref:ArsR/SmtB family transcription factor n=1 Tax=Desemzia sp. RIT 804 TaxID=2810209 RepID=UPI0019504236|nr:metalloregulator ArsR/SmtB family transcription factor [Desemzia sp. RIT 804]MBM6615676.1 helix-turn-helix transcriptional regulator [Desemzia sp. RIT 804]
MKPNEELVLSDSTIQKVSKMFKLLSDPTRIFILYLLNGGELNVGMIVNQLNMEQSAVSHQLKTLKAARLVKSRREGKNIIYSQIDEHIYNVLEQVIQHAKE